LGQGTLQVKTYTTIDSALPVSNVPVLVKDMNGSIIYRLYTDSNGLTERVNLYAPDKNCSTLDINNGTCLSEYDVEVKPDERFRKVDIHGIQIFNGINSTLPVELVPSLIGETEQQRIQEYWIPHGLGAINY